MDLFQRRTMHSPTKETVNNCRGKMVHALTILWVDRSRKSTWRVRTPPETPVRKDVNRAPVMSSSLEQLFRSRRLLKGLEIWGKVVILISNDILWLQVSTRIAFHLWTLEIIYESGRHH